MVHHCRLIHAVCLIVLTWKLCPNPLSSESSYSWWTEGEDWRQLRSLTQQHLDQAGQGLEIGCCKRVKGDLMSMWLPSIGCATEDKWSIGFAATKLGITSTGLKEWPVNHTYPYFIESLYSPCGWFTSPPGGVLQVTLTFQSRTGEAWCDHSFFVQW